MYIQYNFSSDFLPQLLVLNLSNNRLQRLESYSRLPAECRNLKGLDLSTNDIRSLQELEHVQGMGSVVEVLLKGNPCQEQARDFATYSSSVRKYFPNLERLVRVVSDLHCNIGIQGCVGGWGPSVRGTPPHVILMYVCHFVL